MGLDQDERRKKLQTLKSVQSLGAKKDQKLLKF